MNFIKKLYNRIVETLAMTAVRINSYAVKYAIKANDGDYARRQNEAGAPSFLQTLWYRAWGFAAYCVSFFGCIVLPTVLVTGVVGVIVTFLLGPVIGYLASVVVGTAFGIDLVNTQYQLERVQRGLEQMFGRAAGPVFA